ncbi:hypothetical protein Bca52824_024767 [Brassica carinata]|uniref:Uncharacterized protein n=1 Tax=Brassica carinata TaxID=52824 RepID=A0A8X8AV02_BRACI|nr:hypothetical protein Bca52824_024767 [Brassica carinata]
MKVSKVRTYLSICKLQPYLKRYYGAVILLALILLYSNPYTRFDGGRGSRDSAYNEVEFNSLSELSMSKNKALPSQLYPYTRFDGVRGSRDSAYIESGVELYHIDGDLVVIIAFDLLFLIQTHSMISLLMQSNYIERCSSKQAIVARETCPQWKPEGSRAYARKKMATFGRETTVKDKTWLKRRITIGLGNSCDVPTTNLMTIKDNELVGNQEKSNDVSDVVSNDVRATNLKEACTI